MQTPCPICRRELRAVMTAAGPKWSCSPGCSEWVEWVRGEGGIDAVPARMEWPERSESRPSTNGR